MQRRRARWLAILAASLLSLAALGCDDSVKRAPQAAVGPGGAGADLASGIAQLSALQEASDAIEMHQAVSPTATVEPSDNPPSDARRAPRVAIDPGHGGSEIGAVHYNAAGQADVVEKSVNLEIGLRLAELLRSDGFGVVMTRGADESANEPPLDHNDDGRINIRDDLQARVDKANQAAADVFISIHNNGHPSPSQSGTEVWYDGARSFAEKNLTLAGLTRDHLIAHLAAVGYAAVNRGIHEDSAWRVYQGRPFSLFVLGPVGSSSLKKRATEMPGVLGESLFVSNPTEADLLQQDRILQALAQGYRAAIHAFFGSFPVDQSNN